MPFCMSWGGVRRSAHICLPDLCSRRRHKSCMHACGCVWGGGHKMCVGGTLSRRRHPRSVYLTCCYARHAHARVCVRMHAHMYSNVCDHIIDTRFISHAFCVDAFEARRCGQRRRTHHVLCGRAHPGYPPTERMSQPLLASCARAHTHRVVHVCGRAVKCKIVYTTTHCD